MRDDIRFSIWVYTSTNPGLKVVDIKARSPGCGARSWPWTTPSPTPVSSGRSSWAPRWSSTPPPSTSAVIRHGRRRRGGIGSGAARADPLRAERGGAVPGPPRLLPCAPRAQDARHSCARAHRQRARAERVPGRGARGLRRALARLRRHGVVQASEEARRIACSTSDLLAGGVAREVESLIEVPQSMTHQSVRDRAQPCPGIGAPRADRARRGSDRRHRRGDRLLADTAAGTLRYPSR